MVRIFISIIFLLFLSSSITAQETVEKDTFALNKTARGLTKKEVTPPLKLVYFYADNPDKTYADRDTNLYVFFHEYNPARQRTIDHATLGNMGTPYRPLTYQSPNIQGFNIGLHQFDLYKHDFRKVKFYQVNKTYTDLFYSQGALQDEFIFKAKFTRNVAKRTNLSLDYLRLAHEGQYFNQKSRHTALNLNGWYKSKLDRHKILFSYTLNDIQQEENGGVTVFNLFSNSLFDNRQNIPVALEQAFTTQKEHAISLTQYLSLRKTAPDSIKVPRRQFTASHQLVYRYNENLFTDTELAQDSSFYGDFQVDSRGLRHFIKGYSIENHFTLSTFKPEKQQLVKKQKDLLTVGLSHFYHNYDQEPRDTIVNNLFLTGKWVYNFKETIQLNTIARLGLWDNAGDYRLYGTLDWKTKKLGQLKLIFLNQLYTPSLTKNRVFITQQAIWDNNFDKILETTIGAEYKLSSFDMVLSFKSHLINNYIYFNTEGYPQQEAAGLGVLHFSLYKGFNFLKRFHLQNWLTFQQATNSDIIRLPNVFSKHSLFYEGHIAKKIVLARLGIDFRFNTPYKADAYQPLFGEFYIQNDKQIPFYPLADVFLDFKVKKFRGFVKLENVLDWIFDQQTYEPYYTTPYHPNVDGVLRFDTFRMGIAWQFED